MKRFIAVLSGILVLPAFAEVAPLYYDEIAEYTDDMLNAEDVAEETTTATVPAKQIVQRNTINRSTSASRAISAATNSGTSRVNTTTRAMASSPRSTANTARGTVSRTARTNNVVARGATTQRASVTARTAQTTKPVTARTSVQGAPMAADKTSATYVPSTQLARIERTSALVDSGERLYNPNSRVASISTSSRRSAAPRLSTAVLSATSTAPVVTEEEVKTTTDNLTAIAELTDYCKAQYAACMDNYCNVLDDNQGRCSCSKNLKNYSKTEDALATATEQFQEVVQKIRYIGLTGPQIEALFAETEAELAMKSNSDSSQLKTSLDAIKRKVVDVSSPTSSAYDVTSGLSLDLNGLLTADFTAGFDLNSFLGTSNNNTSSVSNQRGDQLYKTAANRCKTAVLNSCTAQGIEANVITNSYDLEIDKQCIAYERALTEANTEMKNNVFNATNILQQARLLLTQNKNSYDLRGCVAAIDSCMQDEYVCGSDYELCLDPTGKYLANGEIVKGGTPGISGGQNKNKKTICDPSDSSSTNCETLDAWTSGGMYDLYATWNYGSNKNAWSVGIQENLGGYIDEALTTWKRDYTTFKDTTKTENLALYLLQKVGYIDDDDKVHGLCATAMKQCQDYTFNSQKTSKKYIPDNEVVRQYLNNTLAKIKVQQDAIISSYAEGCRQDVQTCLTTNGYNEDNKESTVSKSAVNACVSEIKTCMSATGYKPSDGTTLTLSAMRDWVADITESSTTDSSSSSSSSNSGSNSGSSSGNNSGNSGSTTTSCNANYYLSSGTCTACPTLPVWRTVPTVSQISASIPTESTGGSATICHCPSGYTDKGTSGQMPTGCYIDSGSSSSGGTSTSCQANYYLNGTTCQACPSVQEWRYGTNGLEAVDGGSVQTVSTGGSATYCSCPSGYATSETGMPTGCMYTGS